MTGSINTMRICNRSTIYSDVSLRRGLIFKLNKCKSSLQITYEHLETAENDSNSTCRQSPINIVSPAKFIINAPTNFLDIQYKNTIITSTKNDDDGHISYVTNIDSNYITKFNGYSYTLLQFHFHSPAEHQINEKIYTTEVHFVHKDITRNEYLVIAIFLDSDITNDENVFDTTIYGSNETSNIDMSKLNDVLSSNFFVYGGSLTTSPFNADVTWVVFTQPTSTDKNNIDQPSIAGSPRPVQTTIHPAEVLEFTSNYTD